MESAPTKCGKPGRYIINPYEWAFLAVYGIVDNLCLLW
jgi:hypothetical protein